MDLKKIVKKSFFLINIFFSFLAFFSADRLYQIKNKNVTQLTYVLCYCILSILFYI